MSIPPRTTSALVQGILGADYGPIPDGLTLPDLTPYIATASSVVDQIKTIAAAQNSGSLQLVPSDTGVGSQAEILERWLAAHFYCVMDPTYTQRSTMGASGGLEVGQAGKGFKSTKYGRMAVTMDYSMVLENLSEKKRARADWLGKPVSAQTPYVNRD